MKTKNIKSLFFAIKFVFFSYCACALGRAQSTTSHKRQRTFHDSYKTSLDLMVTRMHCACVVTKVTEYLVPHVSFDVGD